GRPRRSRCRDGRCPLRYARTDSVRSRRWRAPPRAPSAIRREPGAWSYPPLPGREVFSELASFSRRRCLPIAPCLHYTAPMHQRIYKICDAALWRAAEASGVFSGAPVDLADGYIHFSTAAQLRETARRHFAGQDGLILAEI